MKCGAFCVVLVLLASSFSCLAQPLQERESRQMKNSATGAAEAKMLDESNLNVTPPMQSSMPLPGVSIPGLQMPINQMALNAANIQLSRYPNYASLIYGLAPGLQANIANSYPNFETALGGQAGPFGMGIPSNTGGFMFGAGNNLFPNVGNTNVNGFVPPAPLDNFAALNNAVNLANVQGLSGALSMATGFYPPGAGATPMSQQLVPYPLGGMNINPYAQNF